MPLDESSSSRAETSENQSCSFNQINRRRMLHRRTKCFNKNTVMTFDGVSSHSFLTLISRIQK